MAKIVTCLLTLLGCLFCASVQSQNGIQLPGGVQLQEQELADDAGINSNAFLYPNESIDKKINANIFVKTIISKHTCYIGEPILVTYKLYTRLRSQSKLSGQPAFTGCTVYELTTSDLQPENELVNGRMFKAYIIRKVALVPLQTGNLNIDIASVDNEISFCKTITEAYQQAPSIIKNVTLHSTPIAVRVQPLPTCKDSLGTIAVGNFAITATVAKPNDTANENNTLQIVITGKGNFANIEMPQIAWPASFEHFEATRNENINTLSFPAEGKLLFTIPFVAKNAGVTIIPPIEFRFFNPNTNSYATVFSDSLPLHILPQRNAFGVDVTKITPSVGNKQYLWIVGAIAFVVMVGLWLYSAQQKQTETVIKNSIIPAKEQTVEMPSETIAATIITSTNVTNEVVNELLLLEDNVLFYKAAKQLLTTLLNENRFSATALQAIIQLCDEALYAPILLENKEAVLRGLESLIHTN